MRESWGLYEAQRRSESKGLLLVGLGGISCIAIGERTTGPSYLSLSVGRRKSVHVGTRKMVNYACAARSQWKH